MFGAHDEHVAPVAVGDHLLLQVLRRVLAPQVRFECPAQPRSLFAQPIADALQLGARVVDDISCRIDLAPHVRRFSFERGDRVGDPAQDREVQARPPNPRGGGVNRSEEAGEGQQLPRLEGASFDALVTAVREAIESALASEE